MVGGASLLVVWLSCVVAALLLPTCESFQMAILKPETCRRLRPDPIALASKTDDEADADDVKEQLSPRKEYDPVPSLPVLPIAVAAVAFVSFWPLLALLRVNGPTAGFDVDMFMALKNIFENGDADRFLSDDIVELPQLSPAEQMVGAIFGPPSSY